MLGSSRCNVPRSPAWIGGNRISELAVGRHRSSRRWAHYHCCQPHGCGFPIAERRIGCGEREALGNACSMTVRECARKGCRRRSVFGSPRTRFVSNSGGFLETRSAPATPWTTITIAHGHLATDNVYRSHPRSTTILGGVARDCTAQNARGSTRDLSVHADEQPLSLRCRLRALTCAIVQVFPHRYSTFPFRELEPNGTLVDRLRVAHYTTSSLRHMTPENTPTIFLSCITREFGRYRIAIARQLERSSLGVVFQERFPYDQADVVTKLYKKVAACDVVAHFVGRGAGAPAAKQAVDEFLRLPPVENQQFLAKVAKLHLTKTDLYELTYTQWEAVLALCLGKDFIPLQPSLDIIDGHPEGETPFQETDLDRQSQRRHSPSRLNSKVRKKPKLFGS